MVSTTEDLNRDLNRRLELANNLANIARVVSSFGVSGEDLAKSLVALAKAQLDCYGRDLIKYLERREKLKGRLSIVNVGQLSIVEQSGNLTLCQID